MDFELCKKYLIDYIENMKKQINQCQFEITKYSQTCPIKELSFNLIQQRLKELVDRERKYLSKRNNEQLIKFKNDIHEKNLLKTISTYLPKTTNGQVNINRSVFFFDQIIFYFLFFCSRKII